MRYVHIVYPIGTPMANKQGKWKEKDSK